MNMTRRQLTKGAMALAGIPLLSGCAMLFPHWTYRYRLTVEVEQNGKLRSGSSVIEVRREKGLTGIGGTIHGEATIVDLGQAGLLFALLSGQEGSGSWAMFMPHHALASQLGTINMVDEVALDRLTRMNGASAVLKAKDYPNLARFGDIYDPGTIEQVDPSDLSASFGSGIKLIRVIIQITDDPLQRKIRKILPWLNGTRGSLKKEELGKNSRNLSFGARISDSDFVIGENI